AWNISFYYLAANLDFAGRNDGISGIPAISVGGIRLLGTGQIYYLIWATVAVAAVLTGNLLNSRMGRAIRALRGGALAAESFGIETSKIRILAFVYAAALAAAAGWLYAHLQRTVNPTPFSLGASIDYLLMIVVGGAGYIAGAIAGSAIVLLIKDQLQNMLPTLLGTQLNFEVVVFGAALVLILQYARDGFWPRVAAAIPILGPALPEAPGKAEGLPGRKRQGIATPLVSVRDLSKTFGGLVAVGGVSFDINRGEIAGLIGPNGAGKSTVFNLISGVLAPSGGKVVFDGLSIGGLPAHKIARLGMARTFQHVKLVPDMTVIENVALGAHLRGSAGFFPAALRLERHEEAKLLAEAQRQIYRVGLHSVSQKPAATLPLGQQRLVEVARALCSNPVLLLLDEPAAGLRHLEKQTLSALLHSLKEDGMTILLVEHDMDFVGGLADRLIVMNFGSKLAEGKPQAVRENPSVVEAYLGSTA
ncbi:MAG TPA: branched-chain amino acid ABC transporter ATP-binding protein/permease, partial [Hyphomicrobiales bacterium]|nr:branched-chain amino acid ABC transporter ATP-binding protein/permease [Hyphomicrobiales bacterium]